MSENNFSEQIKLRYEAAFDRAIKNHEFVVWCQPQYDTVSQKVISGEALTRWQTESGDTIKPSEFIAVFEEDGLIEKLDEYVFRTVCEYQQKLYFQNLKPVPVSVNISRISLSVPGKVESYKQIIESYNIPKRLVPIEFTESAVIDSQQIKTLTDDFRAAGFSLHMDDFGSGYSTLANLSSLDFDVIKLDKSLTDEIGTPRGEEIIRHIIELAHFFKKEVIAEGVEYRPQYNFLKQCGCEVIQGYYFSKAITFEEFIELQQTNHVDENTAAPTTEESVASDVIEEDYSMYKGIKKLIAKKWGERGVDKFERHGMKGEKNATYNANRFSMRCMGVSLLVLFACWIFDVLNIFIVDLTIMNTAIISGAVVYALTFAYAVIAGIDRPISRYVIMTGLILMYTVIFMQLSYHTTLVMMFPLICSMMYFDKNVTKFAFVVTFIGTAMAVMVGYRIGLCDANMLLLTYTTSAVHSTLLKTGDFVVNENNFLIFLFFVFPKWVLLYAIMPLLNNLASDIQSRTQKEAKIKQLAEHDGLTGVHNRYKYVQDVNNYYPSIGRIAVLYFDINNLKRVNDSRGHECGDKLICALSEIMQKYESDTCRTYRIGGDEFVTIFTKNEVGRIDAIRNDIIRTFESIVIEDDIKLSVAVGLALGYGNDIENLINMADADMYRNKSAMKNI